MKEVEIECLSLSHEPPQPALPDSGQVDLPEVMYRIRIPPVGSTSDDPTPAAEEMPDDAGQLSLGGLDIRHTTRMLLPVSYGAPSRRQVILTQTESLAGDSAVSRWNLNFPQVFLFNKIKVLRARRRKEGLCHRYGPI